jgi:hypothetical protein
MWNEAVFAGIWIGGREIKRVAYQELFASTLADTSSNWMHFGGPDGIRTLDLLNAMLTVDRPLESTRVVFEFKPDSDNRRFVRQSPRKSTP